MNYGDLLKPIAECALVSLGLTIILKEEDGSFRVFTRRNGGQFCEELDGLTISRILKIDKRSE